MGLIPMLIALILCWHFKASEDVQTIAALGSVFLGLALDGAIRRGE